MKITAVLGLVLLSLLSFFARGEVPQGISVSLSAPKSSVNSAEAILLEVTYRNVSSQPIRMLKRGTALENGIFHDFLVITLNGQRLSYSGWHAKRLPPTEADYITFLPGDAKSSIVDLSKAYAMTAKGRYRIEYNLDHSSVRSAGIGGDGSSEEEQPVSSFFIRLSEDRAVSLLKRPARNINNSCTASEFSTADAALSLAERIAISASQDLDNAPIAKRPNAVRYLEWFGAYSSVRYDQVANGMRAVALAAANQVVGFDCNCRAVFGDDASGIFAAVNPNDPYNILLCDVFWRVRAVGTDSQSGTIVHELSHFNILAGTDDFDSALDQRGSRALADQSPSSAIRNANAFEYFAENMPFLTMPSASDDDGDPDDSDDGGLMNAIIGPILSILLDE